MGSIHIYCHPYSNSSGCPLKHGLPKHSDETVRPLRVIHAGPRPGRGSGTCSWTCPTAAPSLFSRLQCSAGEGAQVPAAPQVQQSRPPPGGSRESLGRGPSFLLLLRRFRLTGTHFWVREHLEANKKTNFFLTVKMLHEPDRNTTFSPRQLSA